MNFLAAACYGYAMWNGSQTLVGIVILGHFIPRSGNGDKATWQIWNGNPESYPMLLDVGKIGTRDTAGSCFERNGDLPSPLLLLLWRHGQQEQMEGRAMTEFYISHIYFYFQATALLR